MAINVVESNRRARGTVRPKKQKGLILEWRKFYCRAMQEKGEAPALKTWTLWWFSGKTFYRKNWEGNCRVWNSPLIGWRLCSRNLNDQPSGSNQSGVQELLLSMRLPSSTSVGALVPIEFRDVDQIVCTSPKEEPRPGPIAVLSFPFLSLLKYSWYTVW